jgi:Matrixin
LGEGAKQIFDQKEIVMLPMVVEYMPILDSSPVSAYASKAGPQKELRSFSYCQNVQSLTPDSALNAFGPVGAEVAKALGFEHKRFTLTELRQYKVTVVQSPKHGELRSLNAASHSWMILPRSGYEGPDRVVFQVEGNGKAVRVIYNLLIRPVAPDSSADWLCTSYKFTVNGQQIEMSTAHSITDSAQIAGSAQQARLSSLLSAVSAMPVNLADLQRAGLGMTDTSGITLHNTAAGHGWFIDTTPLSNDEYLPTSDPNIWQAKASSEPDGKMDLLTVLLHEYGHALGLERSASSRDAMTASLLGHLGFLTNWEEGRGNALNPTPNTAPTVDNVDPHQHHFHIMLQPPRLRSLTENLVAQASSTSVSAPLAQPTPKQITPYIVRRVEQLAGQLCDEVENPSSTKKLGDTDGAISPAMAVGLALKNRLGVEPVGRMITNLVEPPKHGQIQHQSWLEASRSLPHAQFQYFKYTPVPNFYGKDKVKFEVAVNGKTFRVTMTISVVETHNEPPCKGVIATGEAPSATTVVWETESIYELVPLAAADLRTWLASAKLLSFLTAPEFITYSFKELQGAALGATTTTGPLASIALDTDAAGHGWFLDSTLLSNEEYLPTSDPNVWRAKAGSEVEGKVELLTVLLPPGGAG